METGNLERRGGLSTSNWNWNGTGMLEWKLPLVGADIWLGLLRGLPLSALFCAA